MPKIGFENEFNTRSKGGYIRFNNQHKLGSKFEKSFFPHTAHFWNSRPKHARCKNIPDFKDYMKKDLKP